MGTMSIHRFMPNENVMSVAHEHGCRFFAVMDPVEGFEVDNDTVQCGKDLRGIDLRGSVTNSQVSPSPLSKAKIMLTYGYHY